MARQFDVCVGCQQCVALCAVFPLAFDQILATPGADAGECTPAQQDLVVDACTFCGECVEQCVHTRAPASVDIFALMLRMQAVRRQAGLIGGPRSVKRVAGLLPTVLRVRRAQRHCVGGVFDGDDLIGCCGLGARFVGDVEAAQAAGAALELAVERAGVARPLRCRDARCEQEVAARQIRTDSDTGRPGPPGRYQVD